MPGSMHATPPQQGPFLRPQGWQSPLEPAPMLSQNRSGLAHGSRLVGPPFRQQRWPRFPQAHFPLLHWP